MWFEFVGGEYGWTVFAVLLCCLFDVGSTREFTKAVAGVLTFSDETFKLSLSVLKGPKKGQSKDCLRRSLGVDGGLISVYRPAPMMEASLQGREVEGPRTVPIWLGGVAA